MKEPLFLINLIRIDFHDVNAFIFFALILFQNYFISSLHLRGMDIYKHKCEDIYTPKCEDIYMPSVKIFTRLSVRIFTRLSVRH